MSSCRYSSGSMLGPITPAAARRFVMDEIRTIAVRGDDKVRIEQEKRFINADAMSVDGKWYPVSTSEMFVGVRVTCEACPAEGLYPTAYSGHLDENGRWK